MLYIEIVMLCVLFWIICYFNTGSDEINIKSYTSYPDEVQNIVNKNPLLFSKIKVKSPFISFLSNIIIFAVVIFIFGFFIRQQDFLGNFINLLILGQCLNVFDFFVIDLLWWRNSKRVRFSGTEDMQSVYRNVRKHLISFFKGIVVFLIIAIIDGFLLSFIK